MSDDAKKIREAMNWTEAEAVSFMNSLERDVTEKIERTDRGYRLTIESTRGTGTRDQDKVKAEARTETMGELRTQKNRLLASVCSSMDALRGHQPDAERGGEDDE